MPGEVLDDVALTAPVLESSANAPDGDADCKLKVSVSLAPASVAAAVKTVPELTSCLLRTVVVGRLEKVGLLPEETVAYTAYRSLVVDEKLDVSPTLVAAAPVLR